MEEKRLKFETGLSLSGPLVSSIASFGRSGEEVSWKKEVSDRARIKSMKFRMMCLHTAGAS